MFGWFSRADALTSAMNRSRTPGRSSFAGMIAFTATMRFIATCRAL
jgi:hypothetical protein